jgi:deoxyribodipyrimidine photo-lyase
MADRSVVVWFRNDLRLADNKALAAAAKSDSAIVCVFVLDDETPGTWKLGGASRWWLNKSLTALANDIEARGGRLVLRRGNTAEELPRLVKEAGATAVYFTRSYEPSGVALEETLKTKFDNLDVAFKRYGGNLLREPEEMRTKTGDVYKVYTPFSKALMFEYEPPKALPAPKQLAAPAKVLKSEKLASWGLHPTKPDWSRGFDEHWQPGESGAHKKLKAFLAAALSSYKEDRNRPDKAGTSRLSPHLHFGEITPAQCWTAAAHAGAALNGAADQGLQTFVRELIWREFSNTLLFYWPDLPEVPFRRDFAAFPWHSDAKLLTAWQRGETGYPIVDAGMRELWHTGYMHNRVRMVVASFLIKHLLIPWQDGEAWFWDTLVDADLANNAASWQWVAGSGADAAPYYRIFNPVLQGVKFDPDGIYVKRWVPELKSLSADILHAPWMAEPALLKAAGVVLGKTYPQPIVDHTAARDRALRAYEDVKAIAKK